MIFHVLVCEETVVASQGDAADVPWWSFTKTVLAAAALALVRDGRLALDDSLRDQPYTLRQLLQHRAGLTNYGGLTAYQEAVDLNDDAWSPLEMLARAKADRLLYQPGTGWAYSNIGYFRVRELIERATESSLNMALDRLVLRPLGIEGVRLATQRSDFSAAYDPKWVYHGLLVGPLREAATLLQRLLTGDLLPPTLISSMLDRYPVGGPIAGRPWKTPGYGLGLMIGNTTDGGLIAGHSGSGPGSVIAVYHSLDSQASCSAAAFEADGTDGTVEEACVSLLRRQR
jgi:CubicO group peptidase (beta-lactamase class C family)